MYVSELYIVNYKSIKKEKIKFNPGKNVLVGKNNAGKSNIIKALELLLGERYPTTVQFEERDFYCSQIKNVKESSRYFFIAVKLEGEDYNVEEIKKLKGLYIVNLGNIQNPILYLYDYDKVKSNDEDFLFNDLLFSNISDIDKEFKEYKGNGEVILNFFKRCEEFFIFLYVDRKDYDNENEFKKAYSLIVKNKDDGNYYRIAISNELKNALITCAVLPAFRDPQNQFRINSWTWYGKLIRNIWESGNREIKSDIQTKLSELKEKTEKIFKEAVVDLKNNLEKAIYNTEISFQMLQNTNDDLYKGINIFVNDGIDSPLYDKGSGIQSAIAISLFSYYCNRFHRGSSLLVVEEPEIYLHPQAKRALSQRLDDFVDSDIRKGIKNQVIITTHSPEFVRNTPLENIIVVRKENNIETKISRLNAARDIKEIQKISNILWSNNAEILFADKVILVEGGEFYLLPLIADNLLGEKRSLEARNISIAKVGGKSYFKSYMQLLSDLNIECFVIADFDILENGIEDLKEFMSEDLKDEISKIKGILNSIREREKNEIDYREIRKTCSDKNSLDAKKFYEIIERVCQREEYDQELRLIWEYIKSRHQKKINGKILDKYEVEKKTIYDFIDKLKNYNIFVMKRGELEDYITDYGEEIASKLDLKFRKELKIIKFAEMIEEGEEKLSNLFNYEEYEEILKIILNFENKQREVEISEKSSLENEESLLYELEEEILNEILAEILFEANN
ncbi:SMC domain protein [Caldicellulosiruptor acetigenus I77R1B]|uniref:SMC domain protein n=1 Tax=Caldicellulosiruptor acetigenus (strain ATCC 700853 / DSM 12137 / I77R1B) TaxID=632335 RepID=E4SA27_CALA7|nr:AAA family ATPase [Caldicellulosiruptor acetigenus]ADQ41112.1 SMC domain protein [Caldicellulosiruptor acetigenus I77R1B]